MTIDLEMGMAFMEPIRTLFQSTQHYKMLPLPQYCTHIYPNNYTVHSMLHRDHLHTCIFLLVVIVSIIIIIVHHHPSRAVGFRKTVVNFPHAGSIHSFFMTTPTPFVSFIFLNNSCESCSARTTVFPTCFSNSFPNAIA